MSGQGEGETPTPPADFGRGAWKIREGAGGKLARPSEIVLWGGLTRPPARNVFQLFGRDLWLSRFSPAGRAASGHKAPTHGRFLPGLCRVRRARRKTASILNPAGCPVRLRFQWRHTSSRSFMNRIVRPVHSRHSPHTPDNRRLQPASLVVSGEGSVGAIRQAWITCRQTEIIQ